MPTPFEQYGNVISHAIAVMLSLVGVDELLKRSRTTVQLCVACVYGTLLCGVFLSSTGFHLCCLMQRYPTARRVLHFCDRMVIYLFIAASYMPWLLLAQSEYDMLMQFACAAMWLCAAFGTMHQFRCVVGASSCMHHRVLESKKAEEADEDRSFLRPEPASEQQSEAERPAKEDEHPVPHGHRMPHVPPTVIFYVAYATCPAVILCMVHQHAGLSELAFGGLFYLCGIVFFKLDGILPLAHTVWHTFVTLGAATQFFAIRNHFFPL